jgi:hypothetical protein
MMAEIGCSGVRVRYDGSGDSGCAEFEELIFEDQNDEVSNEDLEKITAMVEEESQTWTSGTGWKYNYAPVQRSFIEIAQEIAYVMLSRNAGGWEINEGSHGEVEIFLDPPLITLEHTGRIEEQPDEEDEDSWEYRDATSETYTFEPELSPMEVLTDGIQRKGGE